MHFLLGVLSEGDIAVNQASRVTIPVKEATAVALSDVRRREAVGRLVDRLVRPNSDDPLIALFERTVDGAKKSGLTEAEIEAELAVYNAEHRA